jgi:predicted ATP-grasp superfamily ATP-dependent carboligase
MSLLRYLDQPELRKPTLIIAFAGWSDVGAAATSSAQYLVDRWQAKRLAEIEAEEFYDFTQHRPMVRYEGDRRVIDWPENAFYYHQLEDRDFIVFNGIEPHLRWRTYADLLMEAIDRFDVGLVVSLGALYVEFPHTRPIRITGTAPTPDMLERAGIIQRGRGRYQGPTGINGVFSARLQDRDLPVASVWANVPHYVSATPNPTASLALLRALTGMLEIEVRMGRMIRASAAFERQLNEATSQNEQVREYIQTLESRLDEEQAIEEEEPHEELPSSDKIVQEIEELLRRPRDES